MGERSKIALALCALTVAIYAEVGAHAFVDFDDTKHIALNPDVAPGWSPERMVRVFTHPHFGDFIPLTYVSLQVDRSLFGPGPGGTLWVNVALHAASAVLLFLALARMTGAIGRSAFVAAVFAAHPLHVESVAWAFERKDALSGACWMLSLLAYSHYAERPEPRRLIPVAASFAAGLLAKPIVVTLPFVLLLLDYWPLARLRGDAARALPDARRLARAALEKWPLFAIAAAGIAITLATQRGVALPEFAQVRTGVRVAQALDAIPFYLAKSLWPTGLAVYYPHSFDAAPVGRAAVIAAALAAITVAALCASARRPYLAVGWLWFLGTLVPVLGLVPLGLHVRADRYAYLPQTGLAILAAWGGADLFAALGGARARRRELGAAGLAVVAGLAIVSWHQVRHWRSTYTLFEHALAVTSDNFVAHWRLGAAYGGEGHLREAVEHLSEAVRIEPRLAQSQFELAATLDEAGDADAAFPHYRRALELDPSHAEAGARWGVALVARGRFEEARPLLERALELDPAQSRAHA
ncbi:MAG TPA: tetratricopeptide repeat protein, partial [Myxococcota bacterium]|nr:tetratricopeptide repeat protein [Myxococcota bacterium]